MMDGSQLKNTSVSLHSIDIETMLNLTKPLNTSILPRWKRKQNEEKVESNKYNPLLSNNHYTKYDRFIPNRNAMNFEVSQYKVLNDCSNNPDNSSNEAFKCVLAENLKIPGMENSQDNVVLRFKEKAPQSKPFLNNTRMLFNENIFNNSPEVTQRDLPTNPDKILDAPDIVDDYYLNLLDWNDGNILAVALGSSVYLWNASNGKISELVKLTGTDDYVCSLSYVKQSNSVLAIGTSSKQILLYDILKNQLIRKLNGHQSKVLCLDWNEYILASGSRDCNILLHDVRVEQSVTKILNSHTQEVCNVKWNSEGTLLASGSNDNILNIWNNNSSSPLFTLRDHSAAVKAISWCPFQKNVLASGAGAADRCIKIWNCNNGLLINSIDTGSQVCSLLWNRYDKELLSSHGFSQNQLTLWSFPSMNKIKDFLGHTSRVLHLAVSPDGQTVCSASADETLRLWKIFGSTQYKKTLRNSTLDTSLSFLR